MLFTNTISLILLLAPASLLAVPTPYTAFESLPLLIAKRHLSSDVVSKLEDGVCDLQAAAMPIAPNPLPPPSEGLKLAHVAVGRGTQNYTCKLTPNSSDAPKLVGALATLFNASCFAVRAPAVLANVTNLAVSEKIPENEQAQIMQSGHHEFTEKGVPLFKLITDRYNYGYVQGKSAFNSTAPTTAIKGVDGWGSVAWLKLNATEGDYKEIYRLNTAGGSSPKTCEGRDGDFTVAYAAEYWFWR